jgi:hypothetical protein
VTERVPVAPTVGEIARRLGVAIYRVEYVARTRGPKPARLLRLGQAFGRGDLRSHPPRSCTQGPATLVAACPAGASASGFFQPKVRRFASASGK